MTTSAIKATDVAAEVWKGLGGDPCGLDRLTVTGPAHVLPSSFPVTAVGTGTIAAATMAAAELWRLRGGPTAPVAVDTVAAAGFACRSELFVELPDQHLGDIWDSVAGVYATANGWIRLHTNFRRHRAAALHVLGLDGDPDEEDGPPVERAQVAEVVAKWGAIELEEAIYRSGGCAAVLRSADQWRATPQAKRLAERPRVALTPLGGDDGEHPVPGLPADAAPDRPLAGLRVLDLTRVIAGPVAGRFLAAYGADVLRVDGPDPEDSAVLIGDTTVGKRSTVLDLHDGRDRMRMDRLVADADVVLTAYRPGVMEGFGYDPIGLAKVRPGVVVGTLSAYGEVGPWGMRRGFDSLVQMVSGIADEGRRAVGVDKPVPLPCQLLDHASGYLLAAGVLTGLARRRAAGRGGGWLVEVSLARTAAWLEGLPRDGVVDIDPGVEQQTETLPDELAVEFDGALGHSRHVTCPGRIDGAVPAWTSAPVPLGHHAPHWAG
jgi:hypothetical protein